MQLFNPFRTSHGLLHLSVSFCLFVCFLFLFLMHNFFGIPRYLRFSVPGDCDFSVYCVILYINIYIKNFLKKVLPKSVMYVSDK